MLEEQSRCLQINRRGRFHPCWLRESKTWQQMLQQYCSWDRTQWNQCGALLHATQQETAPNECNNVWYSVCSSLLRFFLLFKIFVYPLIHISFWDLANGLRSLTDVIFKLSCYNTLVFAFRGFFFMPTGLLLICCTFLLICCAVLLCMLIKCP